MKKTAYLTIDDVPSPDFREKIDFLIQKEVPAILFCVGKDMVGREDDLIFAIKQGYILGNHSFSHPHFSDLALEECLDEIDKTEFLLNKVYQMAEVRRPANFFRFPFFDKGGHANSSEYEKDWLNYTELEKKQSIESFLQSRGFAQPDFSDVTLNFFKELGLDKTPDMAATFDQMEYFYGKDDAPWGLSEKEAILARIDEDAPEEGRALNSVDTADIILVHDHANTTALFYDIINRYIEKGISLRLPKLSKQE